MLLTACEQFLGKPKQEIHEIALHTLEGHQRAIMGSMTVEVCLFKNVYSLCVNINDLLYCYILNFKSKLKINKK